MRVDNSTFDNSSYNPGKGLLIRTLWYLVNAFVFKSYIFPFYKFKVLLLRLFGASIGSNVIIKPNVNIKYPWHLFIGDNVWLGESSWIDNLVKVEIGDNVCISQGAFLLTGNHNYSKKSFDLIAKNIVIKDGVWIGAKAIICPGVVCESHSVLSVGTIASKNLKAYTVYSGIPAKPVRERKISL
jgi:putative colanic acid biosynthesis acetyltransferase WcaF